MTKDKAIELLDNLIGMVEDNHGSDYDAAIHMAIDALKAADVVEVVRCKDCKWWEPFNDNMGHCGCDMKHKDQYCDSGKRADT